MKKVLWLAVALFFMSWGQAFATTYIVSFGGAFGAGTISLDGSFTATSNGNGSYTAINDSGSVTVTGQGTTPMTLVFNPNGTGVATSPFGRFFYDNQLLATPPTANPALNTNGLLFIASSTPSTALTSGSGVPTEINIYANGPSSYSYQEGTAAGWGPIETGNFVVSSPSAVVPIPGALLLFGPGLVGLAGLRKRFFG